jgi:putative tryptophan/tyrosine transport system substrate-binding protein
VKILLANSEPSTHDPKRTFGPEDVAQQNSGRAPIPSIANPCCNRVLIGVVPALGKAMRRRDFIKGIAGSATVWPLAVLAQQGERVRRIGMLMSGVASDPELQARVAVFVHGLQQLGWTEGANIRIDIRWGAGDTDRFRRYAAELVALAPDVILAGSGATMSPLTQATHTVPIVFVVVPDPVGAGFVASLERPGGNATGFMLFEYSMSGKWLELLKQIAPQVTRAAILRDPSDPAGIGQFSAIQIAAPSFGIDVRPIDVRDPAEIERGIAATGGGSNGGLIVTGSAPASVHRNLIITLAAKHLLPTVCGYSYMTTSGCLISYGPNLVDQFRRAASYVDRILKGEKPADLPVQAPTKYELVINLKTAKALGLSIPQSLLARADEVIE